MSVTKTGLAFSFVIHLSLIISMPVSRYQIDDKILLLHIVTLVRAFATTIMHHEIKKKSTGRTNLRNPLSFLVE